MYGGDPRSAGCSGAVTDAGRGALSALVCDEEAAAVVPAITSAEKRGNDVEERRGEAARACTGGCVAA